MRVRFSARTHVGMRREVNQDAYGSSAPGAATLLVVCDGMGGHAAGEVASALGVETILAMQQPELDPGEALRAAFNAANNRIYDEGRGSMGTTGVAALFLHNRLYVANVGDSRAYLVREDAISQISRDHSFVSDQVAAGLMTPEQARSSNIRNIITRALGHADLVEVDIFSEPLHSGDTVVLCSDGLHGLVTDAEIAELASMLPLEEAVQRLVDTANERGGSDNITVVIARVDELDAQTAAPADAHAAPTSPLAERPAAPVEKPLTRFGGLLAALALVVLLGLGGFLVIGAASDPAAAPSPPIVAASPRPTTGSPTRPTGSPTAAGATGTPTPERATATPVPTRIPPTATR